MGFIYVLVTSLIVYLGRSIVQLKVNPPKTTQNLFTATVTCSIEDSEITLTSDSGGLVGTLTKQATTGVLKFEDLRFVAKGSYTITAKSKPTSASVPSTSSSSDPITVTEATESISIVFQDTVVIDSSNYYTITVVDQYNINWADTVNLQVTWGQEISDIEVVRGSYRGSQIFKTLGIATIEVRDKVSGVKASTKITVEPKGLKFSYVYNLENTSEQLFNILVMTGVQDSVTADLRLVCADKCSGLKMIKYGSQALVDKITSSGIQSIYFQNFYIVSSGSFYFQAVADGFPSSISNDMIKVSNKFKYIESNFSSNSTSAYTDVTLTTAIYGEDNLPYLYDAVLNMTSSSNRSSESFFQIKTNNGIDKRDIYFKEPEVDAFFNIKINLDTRYSAESSKIKVLHNKIVLDYIEEDWLPTNTKQSFSFDLYLKSNDLKEDIKKYEVALKFETDPQADLEGQQKEVKTKDGKVTIDDLIISDSGDYNLLIKCDSCDTYTTEKFEIDSTACRLGGGPFGCMAVLIFFIIITSVIFFCADRKIANYQNLKMSEFWYRFIHIHPFIAIFIRQPRNRRILISLQLFTSELLTLTLIGAIYAYYDTPIERYERSFTDYYARQLYKGGTGWALAQAGIIPIFFLSFYSIGYPGLRKYTVTICIILVVLCFGAIVGMTIKYCIGYSAYWTANFLIFLLFDIVLMQFIYTIICICVTPERVRDAFNHEYRHAEMTGELNEHQTGRRRDKDSENEMENLED